MERRNFLQTAGMFTALGMLSGSDLNARTLYFFRPAVAFLPAPKLATHCVRLQLLQLPAPGARLQRFYGADTDGIPPARKPGSRAPVRPGRTLLRNTGVKPTVSGFFPHFFEESDKADWKLCVPMWRFSKHNKNPTWKII